MYLKKVEIQGFKSFADKVSFEFNAGITAVVGPNGSGKSNISDAVRWVLGEQSAKSLRGSKMEDVIFAGTEHRKPMGFAEVTLTIDNSDHALPLDYSDVTITRRVYRSGESEYMINKTGCRLKDIHELFLDTGVGRDGYSIIGQGRIDEILSSKSEDRRHIFEEASGIMKYKVRKLEAERKLEATEQNLIRINDIIGELENQIEPLMHQAEVARRYLSLRDSLKELEVNVYIENISKLKERVKEAEENFNSVKSDIERQKQKLEIITKENREKTAMIKSYEERIELSRQEFYKIDGLLEKSNSEIALNNEKINNLELNIERINTESVELERKKEQLEQEEANRQKKLEYLTKQHAQFNTKLSDYQKQLDSIIATLDETEKYIENVKMGIMDKLDLQSDKKTQINNVKLQMDNINKRKNAISAEINQLKLEKDRENLKKEDLAESIRKSKIEINNANEKLQKFHAEKRESEAALSLLNKEYSEIQSDLHLKNTRLKMLKEMENSLEGYARSVRELLKECGRNPELGAGVHGVLAKLVETEGKYELAIETTLGAALQNVVTETENDAKRAIDYLKDNHLGRATFLPVSAVKGRKMDESILLRAGKMKGFIGLASDLVVFDKKYQEIIFSLLGKVVVFDNLDNAIQCSKSFGYAFRIVTLEGDILNTSGSMTGGSREGRNTGILGRSREISEIEEQLKILQEQEKRKKNDILEIQSMIKEIDEEISSEDSFIRNSQLILVKEQSQLLQVEESIKRCEAKIEMLEEEKLQIFKYEEEINIELEKYTKELADIENEIAGSREIIRQHQEKHKEGQSVRDSLHQDITDFKISVNSIIESMSNVKEALEKIVLEKETIEKSKNRKLFEKQRNANEIEDLKQKSSGILLNIKKYEEAKAGKTFETDRLIEEKKVLEEEIYGIVNSINELNGNILMLQEEYSRLEVKKSKAEAEMEAIQNRMWDEYELTFNSALELKKDMGSIAQAQKKINDLRLQIKELGPVNVAAIDDYIKTKERFEFMSEQKNDMEKAKDKLHKVISEITSIMKKQFVEQFELINKNFNIVFRELFEGGRAELILVDRENVLESGIEIQVQPPGKKLQNMMLLSGGERAFTAISLLFAILKLNPAPFCILDEIEAALDDSNVYRFAQYLKKFTRQSQFIVVTHRKGTMEASDTLYGVTMQEMGVSKVVNMKLGEAAS